MTELAICGRLHTTPHSGVEVVASDGKLAKGSDKLIQCASGIFWRREDIHHANGTENAELA
eukprot:1974078-Pleurochrysis_carterae.AAC.1